MRRWFQATDPRERLLSTLAQQLRLPTSEIQATAAWQAHSGSDDSLDMVELVMNVLEELDRGRQAGTADRETMTPSEPRGK